MDLGGESAEWIRAETISQHYQQKLHFNLSHEATGFVNGSDKQSCHVGYMRDGTGVQWEHNVQVKFITSKNTE